MPIAFYFNQLGNEQNREFQKQFLKSLELEIYNLDLTLYILETKVSIIKYNRIMLCCHTIC